MARAALLGLFLTAVAAQGLALSWAPATSSQFDTDISAPVQVTGAALYDPPAYLGEVAEQALGDALAGGNAVGITHAQTLLERARALAPADAYLWSMQAWVHLAKRETAEARLALVHSWSLAPHNRGLAGDRLLLADALGILGQESEDPRVVADRATLARTTRLDAGTLLEAARP